MKRYYNTITKEWYNEGQTLTRKIKNGVFAGIPSIELLLECGFEEWHKPEPTQEELLEQAKNVKLSEIEAYDTSAEVNSFMINRESGWIDRNTRVALLHALDVVEQSGGTTYTVWFNDNPLTLDINTIKQFLSSLELYAIEALNVTNSHIREVKQLQSIQEVKNYDITLGYPEKINLIL